RVLPVMLEQGLGRIVAISSTAAQDGGGNFSTSAYAASKAGVEGLLRGLAKETAGTGVTTAVISPANIDTDIMGGPLEGVRREQFVARTPVGRLGTVEEVGALVSWLVGPHVGFTTGATYNLNGGMRVGCAHRSRLQAAADDTRSVRRCRVLIHSPTPAATTSTSCAASATR